MNQKLDPRTFFFDVPLYEIIELSDSELSNWWEFYKFMEFKWEFEEFNPILGQVTTYKGVSNSSNTNNSWDAMGWKRALFLECKRTGSTWVFYVFYDVNEKTIQKIWQFPSIAELHIAKIKNYVSVLGKDSLKEFTKWIWLFAHGVWIWSFVYLRRIFEQLIFSTYEVHKTEVHSNNFQTLRMEEKIDTLKDYLPTNLVKYKSMYSILSKWIHELSEEECLKYFPIMKTGIELILDEKLKELAEIKKEEAFTRQIQEVHKEIKKIV